MKKVAVIWFPGMNCEHETKLACEAVGMHADIIRWNETKNLSDYDGFILPGGWSFEDRIRAGVISSKDPLLLSLKEEAKKKKPILGICNGCQILVEANLVPGQGEMAVAPNKNPFVSGYYCTWIYMKNTGKKHAFNRLYEPDEVIPAPIAHGEGRFVSEDEGLMDTLHSEGQIAFTYCDKEGNVTSEFPVNPNGSTKNIAGVINKEGNVLALMPHPERGMFVKQLKEKTMHSFEDAMRFTKAAKIFESMKEYMEHGHSS